jgi:predicted DNA-binding antitoxin AbrB/MazE fold protein
MSQVFQAIYDQGVLRPLEPLNLVDQAVVSVTVVNSNPPALDDVIDRQQAALLKFIEKVENTPEEMASDGLTSRDHDQIIYGI